PIRAGRSLRAGGLRRRRAPPNLGWCPGTAALPDLGARPTPPGPGDARATRCEHVMAMDAERSHPELARPYLTRQAQYGRRVTFRWDHSAAGPANPLTQAWPALDELIEG